MAEVIKSGGFPPPLDAHLVNAPSGDPGVYVSLTGTKRALLLDCGDLAPLSHADLVRVTDVFLTHAHMDHAFGFDRVFRSFLGLTRTLRVWGGEGTVERIHGRIRSYEWNEDRNAELTVELHALAGNEIGGAIISSKDRFASLRPLAPVAHGGRMLVDDELEVTFARVDHTVPNLSYRLRTHARARVSSEALAASGLPAGSWIRELVRRIEAAKRCGAAVAGTLEVGGVNREAAALAERLLRIEEPYSLAYVTDARYGDATRAAVTALAAGVDELFCESVFLEEDAAKGLATGHLTTRQCGRLALEAGVRRLRTFHHSPRYRGPEVLLAEVRDEFPGAE